MKFGARVRECRERLGMSQEELAKKVGYKSRSSINKIELGLNDITQHKIKTFADALETTPAYLFGYDSEEITKEDAVADIFLRLRQDSTFYDAVQKLYNLNDAQLTAVITMLSSFEKN